MRGSASESECVCVLPGNLSSGVESSALIDCSTSTQPIYCSKDKEDKPSVTALPVLALQPQLRAQNMVVLHSLWSWPGSCRACG